MPSKKSLSREEKALQRNLLTDARREKLKRLMGQRVREARLELGLTQAQLGRAAGKSQPWTAEVESARQWPPHWLVAGLARATDYSVGWFYGEDA